METTSFKALSIQRLQGNRQGNQEETLSFPDGNQEVNRLASTSPDHVIPWFTKTGREIYLITSERIRQSAPTGKAVFSLSEIDKMRGLPDEQIEAIITTKESFPGATVEL